MKFSQLRSIATTLLIFLFVFGIFGQVSAQTDRARDASTPLNTKVTDPGFRLVVCDGPDLSDVKDPMVHRYNGEEISYIGNPPWYIPCNFNGIMMQIQHLINIMIYLGVIVAVLSSFFIGWLFLKGTEKDRSRAKEMMPKLFWGFVIMLVAWFAVSQIMKWLAAPGLDSLLGK